MPPTARVAALAIAAVLAQAGCGSGGEAASTAPEPAASAPAAAPAAGAKLSANDASVAELERAFDAAGIPNAQQWAREVEDYRPYPADDPSLGKLRGELSKYNPSPEVLDKILGTLQP